MRTFDTNENRRPDFQSNPLLCGRWTPANFLSARIVRKITCILVNFLKYSVNKTIFTLGRICLICVIKYTVFTELENMNKVLSSNTMMMMSHSHPSRRKTIGTCYKYYNTLLKLNEMAYFKSHVSI